MEFVLVLLIVASAFTATKAPPPSRQEVLPPSEPQYITMAKCSFIIFGQFNYEEAKEACATRKGFLTFFTSASEEHAVRSNIDWSMVPGYTGQQGEWVGQLWVGAKRKASSPTGWAWDNILFPGAPVMFTPWVNSSPNGNSPPPEPTGITNNPNDPSCLMMRKDGWLPYNCSGYMKRVKYYGGALCSSERMDSPNNSISAVSTTYCENFLVPPSKNNLALGMIIKKTYFLVRGNFTYDQAVATCASDGASEIVSARSFPEHDFIQKHVDFSQAGGRAWLGMKRQQASNQFFWIDNLPNAYNDPFLPGQPDNSLDCVDYEKEPDGNFGWKSVDCTDQMSALCEGFAFM